jgi:hypothetical protein
MAATSWIPRVGTRSVLDDVVVQIRIAGHHHRSSVIVDAVAIGRLDAVLDRKSGHLDTAVVIDDAVLRELVDVGGDAFRGKMLLRLASSDVGAIGLCETGHQFLGARRTDNVHRLGPMRKRRRQPSGQQQIGHADGAIRMIVGEENDIYLGERDAKLEKPDSRTAADVDQKFLIAGFDQGTGAEAIRLRIGRAAAQQCHAKGVVRCAGRSKISKAE